MSLFCESVSKSVSHLGFQDTISDHTYHRSLGNSYVVVTKSFPLP